MKRREFVSHAAVAPLLVVSAWPVRAQGGFVEGKHYVRLSVPQPVHVPKGKIEVIEFFWYGCPHCNAFEPELVKWSKTLPPDVVLMRVPVAFQARYKVHQRLYYTLEVMNLLETMHGRVFNAIHENKQRLDNIDEIVEFVAKNGVDPKTFRENFDSFSIQVKVTAADALAAGYKVDGVPMLGIHGRFFTSPSLAGEGVQVKDANDLKRIHLMALNLTDTLIEMARNDHH